MICRKLLIGRSCISCTPCTPRTTVAIPSWRVYDLGSPIAALERRHPRTTRTRIRATRHCTASSYHESSSAADSAEGWRARRASQRPGTRCRRWSSETRVTLGEVDVPGFISRELSISLSAGSVALAPAVTLSDLSFTLKFAPRFFPCRGLSPRG